MDFLLDSWDGHVATELPSDDFYDYSYSRPEAVLGAHNAREIDWPGTTVFHAHGHPLGQREVYIVQGVEPNFRWKSFCEQILAAIPHHGNAVLSRFPIVQWDNEDISEHRFESRGMLHCEVQVPGWAEKLHCVCVHLGLMAHHRSRQMRALALRIERLVPANAPLIVAGDFNDWARHATDELARPLGMREVFEQTHGQPARSFPAALPVFVVSRVADSAMVTEVETWSIRVAGWNAEIARALSPLAEVVAVPDTTFDGAALLVSLSAPGGLDQIKAALIAAGASVRSSGLVGSHARRYTVPPSGKPAP